MLETLVLVELFYVLAVLLQAGIAALCGVRVERISFGFGPRLLRVWRFQITWIPLGGYVRLAGLHPTERIVPNDDRRAFFSRWLPLRLLTVLAWPIGAQLALSGVAAFALLRHGTQVPAEHLVVTGVAPNSPAAVSGMRRGDHIVQIDGQAPATPKERLAESQGHAIVFEVRRDGELRTVTVTPAGAEPGVFRVGIDYVRGTTRVPVAPERALREGLVAPLRAEQRIIETLVELVRRPDPDRIVGAVGTAPMVAREADDAERLLLLIPIGACLILFSLLPIPPLPGAQLLGVLLGWRSRRGRNDFAARDVGEVVWMERSIPRFFVFALLPLAAVAAVITYLTFTVYGVSEQPEPLVLVGMITALGLALVSGWPRAWSWGLYLPLWLAPPVLAWPTPEPLVLAASLLVTPLALCTPGVRRYFRQECPVCHQLHGRPVRSSRGHCCLACGSVWRPE